MPKRRRNEITKTSTEPKTKKRKLNKQKKGNIDARKKPLIPKDGINILSNIHEQLLFFNLLSKCKTPTNDNDWELMSKCFINTNINGHKLKTFHDILIKNETISNPYKNNNNNNSNNISDNDGNEHCNDEDNIIDILNRMNMVSYNEVKMIFTDKLKAFHRINKSNVDINDAIINGYDIDLFGLYIFVTKYGGFKKIEKNYPVFNEILYLLKINVNVHTELLMIKELMEIYDAFLYAYESTFFDVVKCISYSIYVG